MPARKTGEIASNYGRVALRQARLQRLLSEAIEQGAMASQEDIAQALKVSVRTVKRDCQELQARGVYLPTRGHLKGLGPWPEPQSTNRRSLAARRYL